MIRKAIAVWILGSLTFVAGLHVLDSFLLVTNREIESFLLRLYPFNTLIEGINPILYLLCSLLATLAFWGATTVVAARNPIEAFLGKVLEDSSKESSSEVELLEAKTSILEMMSETLAHNSHLIAGLRDTVFNVRSEVFKLEPICDTLTNLKDEVDSLKNAIVDLDKRFKKQMICPACGRDVVKDFRLCPYCGENLLKPGTGQAVVMAVVPRSTADKRP